MREERMPGWDRRKRGRKRNVGNAIGLDTWRRWMVRIVGVNGWTAWNCGDSLTLPYLSQCGLCTLHLSHCSLRLCPHLLHLALEIADSSIFSFRHASPPHHPDFSFHRVSSQRLFQIRLYTSACTPFSLQPTQLSKIRLV